MEEEACDGVEDGLLGIVLPPDTGINDTRLDFELLSFGVLDLDIPLLALELPGFEDVDAAPCWLDED
jgi:hypothetical protein